MTVQYLVKIWLFAAIEWAAVCGQYMTDHAT